MEINKYTNLFNLVQCLSITVESLSKAIQLAERLPSERYNAGMFLFKMCLMVHEHCIKRIEIERGEVI